MIEVEIGPAERSDVPEISRIEQASFPHPFSAETFQRELGLGMAHLCKATLNESVVGYIDYWHLADEIHLVSNAVDPTCRRQKIASRMMDFLVDYARREEVRVIYLDVRVSNEAAAALYRRHNFQVIGRRKRYYTDNNEDAIEMVLTLREPEP